MNKVRILPEALVRLIAAGEVVERPASVVKELIENSLDAGASTIDIHLWGAGRTRIRISDDGEGMTPADAKAALERHATSKLTQLEDLDALSTFGFRGEALPSIAAVSRLELSTRRAEAREGILLKLEGGTLCEECALGRPPGTTLDVQDLFFNTPARSKFLKRDSTERSHVLKTVQEIASAHPKVRFVLEFDGKEIFALSPTQDLGERLGDLWGINASESLVSIDVRQGPCRISGYLSAVGADQATRSYQTLFVNRRPVQQRQLNHAVYEAFREWLPVGRHPMYCLFIDLDSALVDVNVHPTKREVRISDERAVYDLLFSSIRKRFSAAPIFEQALAPKISAQTSGPWASGAGSTIVSPRLALELQAPLLQTAPEANSKADWANLRYLGQFQNLYLLFEQSETLLLLDQHAAAERVLYERLLAQGSTKNVARQRLLAPIVWDVSSHQAEIIRDYLAEFEQLGFLLEPFGARSFALKEWPVVLPETKQAQRFLEEVMAQFTEGRPGTPTDVQHRIAASAACRAAVMAGDPLSETEASRLVEDLSACERPMTCPHGRPTHIRLPMSDFHRRFHRT